MQIIANYQLPGSRQVIDLYLPEAPRVAVLSVGQATASSLKKCTNDLQAAFGGRLLIVFLLPEDVDSDFPELAADPQILISHIPQPPTAADLAALIEKIQEVRQRRLGYYPLAAAAAVGLGLGLGVVGLPIAVALGTKAVGVCRKLHSDKPTEDLTEQESARLFENLKAAFVKKIGRSAASHLRRLAGPVEADRESLGKAVEAIMATLNGLIGESALATIRSEADSLLAEYDASHYTACALRAGRCLEAIVFLVAREWQVPIDEPTLACLEAIDGEVQALRRLIIDYNPDATESKRQRNRIVDTAGNVNKHCNRLLVDLQTLRDDSNATPGSQRPSRNIQAILRDIRRRYSQSARVRDEVEKIEPLILEILAVRNDAAHADPRGDHREVSATSVTGMVDNILLVLHRLSNVGCELYETELLGQTLQAETATTR